MISTIGYGLVLVALACATFGGAVGIITGLTRQEWALVWVRRAAYAFAAAMLTANLVMVYALVTHDFSVKYVAQVGSRATPLVFTIVSLWSALEGSILFWGAIMGLYVFAFAYLHRREHTRYMQLAIGMICLVAVFFSFLIAGPANPWTHIPNPLPDGPGPNPLLQNHVLMIIHPPMLYLGYVGLTVPFAIASAALLRGELSDSWMVPLRKWTLVPWLFLSIGIILGGWWAYAVLGWGGYWAWDPVENASFMPWLTATAFIHSTMVLERKRMLKLWTLALAMASFLLTLVGTFMTRSGVFNSVHSFTQSDIGPTFLVFIAVVFVFSVVLLTLRGSMLVAENRLDTVASRETSILLNNVVFVMLTFVVFIGTTYPLIVEALADKRISVGEPYFNKMALPIGLMILFLMGVGPILPWGQSSLKTVAQQLAVPTVAGAATVVVCAALGYRGFMPLLAFGLCAFVLVITLRELFLPARQRMTQQREGPWRALIQSASRARRRFGGYVVHLGIVVIIAAIAASSAYKIHSTATLKPGEAMALGAYQVRFDGLSTGQEPHRTWTAADITLIAPSGAQESLRGKAAPRMNFYERSTDPIGSPAVRAQVFKDLYVTLLATDRKTGAASFNAWIFPLVGWIWYAIPFLVLGTAIALWPAARRKVAEEAALEPAASQARAS